MILMSTFGLASFLSWSGQWIGRQIFLNDVPKSGNQALGNKKPRTNFVEVRTFWHLNRSFDWLWIFLILALQAVIMIAWRQCSNDLVRSVLSIFVTAAILNFWLSFPGFSPKF